MDGAILLVDIGMVDRVDKPQDGGRVRIVFRENEGQLMGVVLVDGVYFDGSVMECVGEGIDLLYPLDVGVGESQFIDIFCQLRHSSRGGLALPPAKQQVFYFSFLNLYQTQCFNAHS